MGGPLYFVGTYRIRVIQRQFQFESEAPSQQQRLVYEMMLQAHCLFFSPADPVICALIADLILNHRCNQDAVTPKNMRYVRKLLMAGSCFLFSSEVMHRDFDEAAAESKHGAEAATCDSLEETELIHSIWGTLKCSLLLLQLHRIHGAYFKPEQISLFLEHVDDHRLCPQALTLQPSALAADPMRFQSMF